jgi:hypothetical protein
VSLRFSAVTRQIELAAESMVDVQIAGRRASEERRGELLPQSQ